MRLGSSVVRGDERVDKVEAGLRHAVELSDAAVRVDLNGGLGIVRACERDEPRLLVLLGEAVKIDGARVEADEAAETRGFLVRPRHQPAAARGDGSGIPRRRTTQYGSASSSRHSHTCWYGSSRECFGLLFTRTPGSELVDLEIATDLAGKEIVDLLVSRNRCGLARGPVHEDGVS